jgi:DNA-binding response OmpR family regulator
MPDMKDVPIVFLSAKGQESEITKGLKLGAEAYILKPFAPDDLIRQIKEIMANIESRK